MEENPAKVPKQDLTLKQRRWLEAYIQTGNATQAALKAYNLDPETQYHSAGQIGFENLKKLELSELMEAMGLTDKALLGMVATGIVKPDKLEKRAVVQTMPDGKKIKKLVWDNVPDYAVRHKYLETAFKLKKRLGPDSNINAQMNAGEIQFVWGTPAKEKMA